MMPVASHSSTPIFAHLLLLSEGSFGCHHRIITNAKFSNANGVVFISGNRTSLRVVIGAYSFWNFVCSFVSSKVAVRTKQCQLKMECDEVDSGDHGAINCSHAWSCISIMHSFAMSSIFWHFTLLLISDVYTATTAFSSSIHIFI